MFEIWYFGITITIGFIIWIVLMIIGDNEYRRGSFSDIIFIPFTPIILPIILFFGFICLCNFFTEALPNLLFPKRKSKL